MPGCTSSHTRGSISGTIFPDAVVTDVLRFQNKNIFDLYTLFNKVFYLVAKIIRSHDDDLEVDA